MLLWTIFPEDLIFQPDPSDRPKRLEVTVGNRVLVLEGTGDGQWRIIRLISAEPGDYLDPRWQPGKVYSG